MGFFKNTNTKIKVYPIYNFSIPQRELEYPEVGEDFILEDPFTLTFKDNEWVPWRTLLTTEYVSDGFTWQGPDKCSGCFFYYHYHQGERFYCGCEVCSYLHRPDRSDVRFRKVKE